MLNWKLNTLKFSYNIWFKYEGHRHKSRSFIQPLSLKSPVHVYIYNFWTSRESWMDISFQYLQQSSVHETKQNGLRGRLCTTVQGKVVTPVFLTTIFQSWLSFVFRYQSFQLIKVETHYLTLFRNVIFFLTLKAQFKKTDLKCIAILMYYL